MVQTNLDPEDWEAIRLLYEEAVKDGLDYTRTIRERPVWQPTPNFMKEPEPLPVNPSPVNEVYEQFRKHILPYGVGNLHPAFWGWVHGAGNLYGVLGDICAAFMNCNVGGRDHVAVYVERQVLAWFREVFGFPASASGILTSGTSMGTLIALTVARNTQAVGNVAKDGVAEAGKGLVGYCSTETHSSVSKAFQLLGLGEHSLRQVRTNGAFELDLDAFKQTIEEDKSAGLRPFCVVANAGTVNTGAIDNIEGVAEICKQNNLWLHVDGAFGGFAILLDEYKDRLCAIQEADSVAFDFHKWLQVPYDAGCVLIKDAIAHRASFSARKDYLQGASRGLASGEPWFCEFGPELSRSFRALKVWFTIKSCGMDALKNVICRNCLQALYLARLVEEHYPTLELMAQVSLNIVCFRYVPKKGDVDFVNDFNQQIVADLHETGKAVPSTTIIGGKVAIRVALVNHRTEEADLNRLVQSVLLLGIERMGEEST